MADFDSGFWNVWIILPTIGGLAAMFWLIFWLGGTRGEPGAKVETMGHVWDENLEEYNNPLPKWWLNMFYITLFFAIGYLALYPGLGSFQGLLGWSSRGAYEKEMDAADEKYGPIFEKHAGTPIPALVNDPEAIKIGERLYATYCTTCHGSDARGVRGFPNLRDTDWLWGGTPEAIVHTIVHGRQGVMPAWEAIIGEEGVFNVTEYVRSLAGRQVDAVVVDKGRQIYATNCAACHGAEGKGNTAMGAPNLTDNIWLHGGSQAAIQNVIAKGRINVMPAWGEFLGEAKVHILSAYIYSLSVNEHLEGGRAGLVEDAVTPASP